MLLHRPLDPPQLDDLLSRNRSRSSPSLSKKTLSRQLKKRSKQHFWINRLAPAVMTFTKELTRVAKSKQYIEFCSNVYFRFSEMADSHFHVPLLPWLPSLPPSLQTKAPSQQTLSHFSVWHQISGYFHPAGSWFLIIWDPHFRHKTY